MSPAALAHGHGLAASTSCARHGKVADAGRPLDRHLPALERLAQRVEHRPRELGRLVEEQHAAVGPAQRARPDLPRPAADQRGHGGRVVRRLEGRPGDQRGAGRQRAGDRVDGGHLERRLPRRAAGAARAAARRASSCPRRAGRSGTGGAHRRPPPRPPADPPPARRRPRGRVRAAPAGRGPRHVRRHGGAAGEVLDDLGEGADAAAPRRARPAPPPRRSPPGRRPARARPAAAASTAGSTPRIARTEPSRPSSPSSTSRSTAVPRNGAGGGQHRGGQREVEAAPLLRHRRRRQPDGDPPLREAGPGVRDRGAHPVDRLAHHRVGQADEHHLRHPGGHVDLDLDHGAVHAGQAHRPGAGERHGNAARRWVTSAGPRRAHEHADDVEPQLRGVLVVRGQPALGQHAQPALLGRGHRLDRMAVADPAAGLDLAEDERVAVAGDDVELALAAAPVAVEQRGGRRRSGRRRRCARRGRRVRRGGGHAPTVAAAAPVRPEAAADLWTGSRPVDGPARTRLRAGAGSPAARGRACRAPRR